MALTYILYSASLDRYYVGSTSGTIEERMRRHLSDHGGYTGRAKDWECKWVQECEDITEARAKEARIKRRKSRAYIEELIGGQ